MSKVIRLSTFFIYAILCFGVAAYSFYFIFQQVNPYNTVASKLMQAGIEVPVHVFAGGLALLLVPFQLSKKLRINNVKVHRFIGYLYVIAVTLGSLSGFIMSLDATGGIIAEWGFRMLAILWLPFTLMAVHYARKGQIQAHKKWMYRSIALTSASITFRIYLGLGLGVMNLPFITVYVPITWLCWTLNLLLVEFIIYVKNRHNHARMTVAVA